jgi:hypothetical protein
VGAEALKLVNTGGSNTGVGLGSLRDVTGSYNTGLGDISLYQLASGDYSTACGYGAGQNQTAGSNNAFFGSNSSADLPAGSNQYNYGDASVTTHKFRNGDVVVGNGNVVMSTSGKGIDFSVTANSSGNLQTSELLDDYEEGTWTPTDASGAGLTFTSTNCLYTKIGRIVKLEGFITYPSTASVAIAEIGGLPFNNANVILFPAPYGTEATMAHVWGGTSQNLSFTNAGLSQLTNATMSGDIFFFCGTYTTAT